MSAAKHTPGPWHVGGRDGSTIYDRYSQRLANSFEGVMVAQRSNAECEANARLIAAAPELLAFAQSVVDVLEHARRSGLHLDADKAQFLKEGLEVIAKAEVQS